MIRLIPDFSMLTSRSKNSKSNFFAISCPIFKHLWNWFHHHLETRCRKRSSGFLRIIFLGQDAIRSKKYIWRIRPILITWQDASCLFICCQALNFWRCKKCQNWKTALGWLSVLDFTSQFPGALPSSWGAKMWSGTTTTFPENWKKILNFISSLFSPDMAV